MSKREVLLVEDEEMAGSPPTHILEGNGRRASRSRVPTVNTAVDYHAKQSYDLIVLDVGSTSQDPHSKASPNTG